MNWEEQSSREKSSRWGQSLWRHKGGVCISVVWFPPTCTGAPLVAPHLVLLNDKGVLHAGHSIPDFLCSHGPLSSSGSHPLQDAPSSAPMHVSPLTSSALLRTAWYTVRAQDGWIMDEYKHEIHQSVSFYYFSSSLSSLFLPFFSFSSSFIFYSFFLFFCVWFLLQIANFINWNSHFCYKWIFMK